jgi:imidazolonepropionase-like amidohydrolase
MDRLVACLVFLAGVFLTTTFLAAQAPSDPVDLLITRARVIDGTGAVHESATLAITGERIEAIHPGPSQLRAALTIDAEGRTVLPGLINAHVHLRPPGVVNEQTLTDYLADGLTADLYDYLSHGVTTIKSAGDPADLLIQVRRRLEQDEIQGPRLFLTGPPLTGVDGHPAATLFKDNLWLRTQHAIELSSAQEARKAVGQLAALGVNAIKLVFQGSSDEAEPYMFRPGVPLPKMSRQIMQAIIDESHRHQLRVTAHTNDLGDALAVLEAGCDGLEHGVSRSRIRGMELGSLLRQREASYIPTLLLYSRRRPEVLETAMRNLQRLADQGVRIVVGTDGIPSAGASGSDTLKELELMVEAGMDPEQVIQAATRSAARHLGKLDDLGTVEAGKLADLIIVDGDPLADIAQLHAIEVVIKGGKIVVDHR